MGQQLLLLAMTTLATSAISLTLTKAQAFAWLRSLVKGKSPSSTSRWGRCRAFVSELFSCPYCASHWVAIAFVVAYRDSISMFGHPCADLVAFGFAIVALASMASGLVYKSIASIGPDGGDEE